MRILLDHNVPAPLRYWLVGHQVETAYERGWAEVSNGDLLKSAEAAGFEVMVTTDQNIRYQQNLGARRLALVVISTNDWTRLRHSKSAVLHALSGITPGSLVEIDIPPTLLS